VVNRASNDHKVVPLVEERAVVLKRKKVTGAVRVRTVVREDEDVIDEPVHNEEIEVERVPVDRWVETPVPVRREGDTTIISLHEEVVVVEKRLRVVEEIRLTKRQTTRHTAKRVTLRREEALVERLDAAADGNDGSD
jgi:stress response protein YsnF